MKGSFKLMCEFVINYEVTEDEIPMIKVQVENMGKTSTQLGDEIPEQFAKTLALEIIKKARY